MTVIEKKAAGGFEQQGATSRVGGYIAIGLAALVIGTGVGWTTVQLVDSGATDLGPAEVAEIRATEQAELMQLQWVAQVNATKGSDFVDRYAGMYAARIAEIQVQRADDLVARFRNQHAAAVAAQGQRAQDMVEFRYGLSSATD